MTLPFLDRLRAGGRLPLYTISQNDASTTRAFHDHFGTRLPTLLDSEEAGFPVSNTFGISMVPSMFLVQPGGIIGRVIEGWRKSEIGWLGTLAGVDPFHGGDSVPEWKAG
jgi:hypothetical protein